MEGCRGYDPKRTKTETNTMRFHFMWNLKNQTKEQTKKPRNRLTNTENKLARGERVGEMGEPGEGDEEVRISSYEINKSQDEKYTKGNILNDIVIDLCGDPR